MHELAELRGRNVLVMGLGSFGGGTGCTKALCRAGAIVQVTDLRPAELLRESIAALRELPITWTLGEHREDLFQWAEVVVVNPGVPEQSPWLQVARREGCRLTTEINLGISITHALPVVAITGTHGKSTCATLTHHLLRGFRPTTLAGNLGGSFVEQALGMSSDQSMVLELSSFQTERLQAPPGWPAVAVCVNLGTDHLDRHRTVEKYHAAKRRLTEFQNESGYLVLPVDDPAAAWARQTVTPVYWFSTEPLKPGQDGMYLRDQHIYERWQDREYSLWSCKLFPFREDFRLPSLLAALSAFRVLEGRAGIHPAQDRDWFRKSEQQLASYPGLAHRMQRLSTEEPYWVVNNGVATHPDPTVAALKHFARTQPQRAVRLIAGGYDKNLPLESLARATQKCNEVHLFGAGGTRLKKLLQTTPVAIHTHSGVREAVESALAALSVDEILLFSPSFASFDEFRNFQDRAKIFTDLCERRFHRKIGRL